MRSNLPKVLHQLAGLPLLGHVLKAIEDIPSTPSFASFDAPVSTHRPIVVLGHESAQVETAFGERCLYAIQEEQAGTGHAVLSARYTADALNPLPQTVLVCYGDTPLIRSEMLAQVLVEHLTRCATVTFLTAQAELPSDYGRIVRDARGQVREIVEVKRATQEQLRINEVNSGVYCFDRAWLWPVLQNLPRNASGEYYLTDLVAIAAAQERPIATVRGTFDETIGINNRVQLAEAEQLLRRRILERHMYAGVTLIDPTTTYIENDVQIGTDTIILPGTMITGKTTIGSDCRMAYAWATLVRSKIRISVLIQICIILAILVTRPSGNMSISPLAPLPQIMMAKINIVQLLGRVRLLAVIRFSLPLSPSVIMPIQALVRW